MGRDIAASSRVSGDDLKTSWPEVVGMAGLMAAIRIQSDRSDVHIEGHYVGESVPPGYDDKRVRIFVNHDALITVAQTPVVG